MFGSYMNPEDGSGMSLRNMGELLFDYNAIMFKDVFLSYDYLI
jgi:hypothetical protein